jgi:hypothetical protein
MKFELLAHLDGIVGLKGFSMSIASLTNAVLNVVFGLDGKRSSNCWSYQRSSDRSSCQRSSKGRSCQRSSEWRTYDAGISGDTTCQETRLCQSTSQSSGEDSLEKELPRIMI